MKRKGGCAARAQEQLYSEKAFRKGRNSIIKKWLALALFALMLITTASAQEFTGTANGFGSPVTVTISVENGAITACAISAESETPSIGGQAANALESTIAENGTVETVSGATMTSNAVSAALMDAMQQAGLVEQTAAAMLPAPTPAARTASAASTRSPCR